MASNQPKTTIKIPTTMDLNYWNALLDLADELGYATMSSMMNEMAELILEKYGKPVPQKARKARKRKEVE